jgi:hypothetical protein
MLMLYLSPQSRLFLSIIAIEGACHTGDLSSLLCELSAMAIGMTEKDCVCANLLLESCFDTVLSQNIDELEAVRNYFTNKEYLKDAFQNYSERLENIKADRSAGIDEVRNFVVDMFKEFKEKLLAYSITHQIGLVKGDSDSLVAIKDRRLPDNSIFSQCEHTHKSTDKGKKDTSESLMNQNIIKVESPNVSKGWISAHYSPISSPPLDIALTCRKQNKSRFVEFCQDARVRAFHKEWPIFQESSSPLSHALSPGDYPVDDISSPNNIRSPINKKKSDMYNDTSPSMISLITKDDKKVINNRVTTFDLLMKNAWYLKNYLRNLPLKKHEIISVIESFYFDDKDLSEILGEHRLERNNTRTLHKLQIMLEKNNKQEKKSPKKVQFNCKQTVEFLGYFDMICKEWVPVLRSIYEKLDTRMYNLWDEFCRGKNLIEFGKKLTLMANKVDEEKKALSKKVVF